jgi:ribosome-binding factor A
MNNRILKINKLFKQEVGKIIFEEIDIEKEILATVIKVDTSNDLRYSKIFISVLPPEKTKEVFEKLNKNIWGIQQILNKKLKMRKVPRIEFEVCDHC